MNNHVHGRVIGRGNVVRTYLLTILAGAILLPGTAFAQYVPVRDQVLITAFNNFRTDFTNYSGNFDRSINTDTDSLRNIIAAGDPRGRSVQVCPKELVSVKATETAHPYTTGSWASALAASASSTSGTLPSSIDPLVNRSASLRCLLQEIVEWQKLGLSIQIHAMLKTYIADAQTKQLNNQLMNQISAASLNWAKAGNEVVSGGAASSEAVYLTNPSQSRYNVNARQLDHITAQSASDPGAPPPVGSLAVCQPWRLGTTANTVRNQRSRVEDPFSSTASRTTCPLPSSGSNFANFSESFNDPVGSPDGGVIMWQTVLNNPAASPLGSLTQVGAEAEGRIIRQEQVTSDKFANTGSRPVTECSGLPNDPYCLDQQYGTDVTPAYQAGNKVTHAAGAGDRMVESGNTLDSTAASSSELQSTALNTAPGGMFGYDETPLAISQTAVNKLVEEFYDTIEIGYYATHEDTQDWAQATMLMIYDEMKFSDTNPQTVVTDGADAELVDI